MRFVVPMFESERGWGSKIDGYTGPFDTRETAEFYQRKYNLKYNNEKHTPDYYIMALEPVEDKGQKCDYHIQEDLLQANLI